MENVRYDRLCRTPHSEAYLLSDDEEPVGRIELHFTSNVVYGLLVLERELGERELMDLIQRVDDDLVWSADVPRDDFMVTVYQGKEIGVFSDPEFGEAEEAEDEDARD